MKVGIIRCLQTEDYCPAAIDLQFAREKKGAFEGCEEEVVVVGISTCGGCPGKKAVLRARNLVERGADTIAFASCITKGNPIGMACPFATKMIEAVTNDVGWNINILDYTH